MDPDQAPAIFITDLQNTYKKYFFYFLLIYIIFLRSGSATLVYNKSPHADFSDFDQTKTIHDFIVIR
jgi:hypothetical protein